MALIEGRAGIGKTRLLQEARRLADASGVPVLSARCGQLERDFPFGVVRQLFEPRLALAEDREALFTGARARREALTGVESLTPSEQRVSNMAAEGLTNREIAQTLFVTPKTVEVHLSNAYRKLGIRSRRQLAGVLTPA